MFYVFHGEDEFSRSEALAKLKAKMGDPAMAELNTTYLDGRRITLEELQHACNAVPFLAERRLVIVEGLLTHLQGPAASSARKGKARGKSKEKKATADRSRAFLEGLLAYLPHLPETTRLVFLEPVLLPKDHPVLRLAQKEERGYTRAFQPPQARDLPRWITGRARRKGGEITRQAAETLAAYVGADLRLLDQELEKLLTYVAGARPVNEEDVRLLVSAVQQANIFEMVDALGRRDGRRATELLHRLLEAGDHPLALLGMIVRQFRILLQVKDLSERGLGPDPIARQLKLHPFVVKKAFRQAHNFSLAQLETILRQLLEVDVAIKTGQRDPVLALDLFVVGVCGSAAPS